MAWVVTKKNIKIHTCIDGMDSVEDTKEIFFLIESNCEITL